MIRIRGLNLNPTKLSYTKVLGDEREIGEAVFKITRKERFHKYDLVRIDHNNEEYQYIVDTDRVVGLGNDLYEHTVLLTELVDRFEGVDVTSRGVYPTVDGLETVGEVLTKYKRELEFYKNIFIDFVEGDWLDVRTVQMEFDGMTFKQVLTRLFRVLGATPKAFFDNGVWYIYPQKWSQRNNLIEPNRHSYYQEADSISYATKIKAQVKNAIYENVEPNWFPSKNGYILPRGAEFTQRMQDLEYKLDSDIVGILKVEVVDVNIRFNFVGEDAFFETFDVLDITDNVVTQEEYDALKITDDTKEELMLPNKNNHVIYNLEDNRIFNLFTEGGGGTRFILFERNSLHLENAIIYQALKKNYPEEEASGDTTFVETDLHDIKLRIQYIRKRDLDILINKHNSNGMNIATEMYNQTSSIVELSQLKNNLTNITNRSGTDKEVYTQSYDTGEIMSDIGDYTADGKVITKAKFTPHKNYVFAEYELNENVASIDEEYQFKRELNPFTITSKRLTTNPIEEVFMIAGRNKLNPQGVLTEEGRKSVLDILDETNANAKKAEFAMYQADPTNYSPEEKIHMPIESGGGSRSISLHASFKKNVVAGWENTTIDGDKAQQPIPYKFEQLTGQRFILPDFKLYIGYDVDFEDIGSYPLVNETQDMIDNRLTFEDSKPIDLGLNDALGYTLMIHTMSETDNIVVGNAFAEYNHIVREVRETDLKLYTSDRRYSIMDDQPREGDSEGNGVINYDVQEKKLEVTTDANYWAITKELDGHDRILVAGNNIYEIYFNFLSNDTTGIGAGTFVLDVSDFIKTVTTLEDEVFHQKILNFFIELEATFNYGANFDYEYQRFGDNLFAELEGGFEYGVETIDYTFIELDNRRFAETLTAFDYGVNATLLYQRFGDDLFTESKTKFEYGVAFDYNYQRFGEDLFAEMSKEFSYGVNFDYNYQRIGSDLLGNLNQTFEYGVNTIDTQLEYFFQEEQRELTGYIEYDLSDLEPIYVPETIEEERTSINEIEYIASVDFAVEWVDGGTEQEANNTPNVCNSYTDVGNVIERVEVISYTDWQVVDTYIATSDESTTQETSRTVCSPNNGQWLCSVEERSVDETETTYETCEFK